jgi:hypothetical protein
MPYVLRKLPNQDCFRVYNQRTKKVYAKCSSLLNAKRQIRLLKAIEYGNFTPTGSRRPSDKPKRTRRKTQKSTRKST